MLALVRRPGRITACRSAERRVRARAVQQRWHRVPAWYLARCPGSQVSVVRTESGGGVTCQGWERWPIQARRLASQGAAAASSRGGGGGGDGCDSRVAISGVLCSYCRAGSDAGSCERTGERRKAKRSGGRLAGILGARRCFRPQLRSRLARRAFPSLDRFNASPFARQRFRCRPELASRYLTQHCSDCSAVLPLPCCNLCQSSTLLGLSRPSALFRHSSTPPLTPLCPQTRAGKPGSKVHSCSHWRAATVLHNLRPRSHQRAAVFCAMALPRTIWRPLAATRGATEEERARRDSGVLLALQ